MAREQKEQGAVMPAPKSAEPKELIEGSLGEVLDEEAPKIVKSGAKGPINVVAIAAGFYKCSRKVEGDKFQIDSEKQLGSWMKKI